MILAIDPGQTGALVWMLNSQVVKMEDMPTMAKLTGKGKTINASALASMVASVKVDAVFIEKVHAMPKQGSASTFEFGYGVGMLHALMAAYKVPMTLVTPMQWKKFHGLVKKEKDAARAMAITKHPEVADQLARKKDIGRADAICIGDYGLSVGSENQGG